MRRLNLRDHYDIDSPLVYTFKSCGLSFYSADGATGRHLIGFIIFHSFLYTGVRDLVCWLDLWKQLSPPTVLQFHSVQAPPYLFTAYFPVTSLGLSLVLGVYIAVGKCKRK
jgi:hypothetical protein